MADIDKPGLKTTELYVATALMIVGAMLTSGLIADGSQLAKILGAAQTIIGGLAYIWSRTSLKTTNAAVPAQAVAALAAAGATSGASGNGDISVVVDQGGATRKPEGGFVDRSVLAMMVTFTLLAGGFGVAFAACGELSKGAKAVAGAIVDCTAKQTATAVHDLRPLGDAMLVNSLDNGKLDWGPVRTLAQGFVSDVSRCVLADAVSRALKPRPVDPNAPKLSPLDVDKDALRAGFRSLSTDLYGGASFKTDTGPL